MSEVCNSHFFIGLPVLLFQTVYMQEIFLLAVYNSALHCKVCLYTKKNKNNIKSYYSKEGIFMDFRHDIQQCILIMKTNEMHYFSNLFDKVLYMFRTGPLSIIRSISILYTRIRYLSC